MRAMSVVIQKLIPMTRPCLIRGMNDAGDQSIVELKWHPDGGKSLRQRYGSGSRATEYRQKKRRAGLQREASEHYSIKELFKRQEVVNLNRGECNDAPEVVPLSMIAHGRSAEPSVAENTRLVASDDLKRLVELPTEQRKKYGYTIS